MFALLDSRSVLSYNDDLRLCCADDVSEWQLSETTWPLSESSVEGNEDSSLLSTMTAADNAKYQVPTPPRCAGHASRGFDSRARRAGHVDEGAQSECR